MIFQTECLAGTVEIIAHNLVRISICSEQGEKQIESSLPSVEFYDCDSPLSLAGGGWDGEGAWWVLILIQSTCGLIVRNATVHFGGRGCLQSGFYKKSIINVYHLNF